MFMSEQKFNINTLLHRLFYMVEPSARKKSVELIYEMGKTLPKEFRGDDRLLLDFLTRFVSFILENSDQKELVLSLNAPKEFIFEEYVTFHVKNSSAIHKKVSLLMEQSLGREIRDLEVVIRESENGDICLDIPLKISELGLIRHYRLANKDMLHKKVLVVSENNNIGNSIKKFFEYFNYVVNLKSEGNEDELGQYDILVTEVNHMTDSFREKVSIVQNENDLKFVLIDPPQKICKCKDIHSINLKKPITQESIWALIETLFDDEKYKEILNSSKFSIIDCKQEDPLYTALEKKKAEAVSILNTDNGSRYIRDYPIVLQRFLDLTKRSDIYFRQIVNKKDMEKINAFCKEIRKQAKLIGAESIVQVIEMVQMIFEHQRYELLSVYPGKYHLEYVKLKSKIEFLTKETITMH